MGAGGEVFKHLKGHLIAQYAGDLITILGPRDSNLPTKIQSVRCMHVWLRCKTFPVFHIIFENYLYMRYSCVYIPKGGGRGWCTARTIDGGIWPASQNPYPIYDQNLRFSLPYFGPEKVTSS